MKHMLKGFFSIALLLGVAQVTADNAWGQPFFAARPQVNNYNRFLVGMTNGIHRYDADCLSGSLAIVPGYQQTFRNSRIGEYFSPLKGSNVFTVGAADTAGVDVAGYNFLLGEDYSAVVELNPSQKNAFVDVDLYLGLDEWICGLWFELFAPINWTRTNVSFCQTSSGTSGAIGRDIGNSPYASFGEAWGGRGTVGDVKQTMNFARVECGGGNCDKSGCSQSKWALADLMFALGYDFINNECSHLGLSLRVIAPTGNRPEGEFVFEPISGSGKHTQIGGGLTAHYEFWNNCCDSSFSVWFDAQVYTMLKKQQTRTFDWKANGKWSRYLLLKKFDADNNFTDELVPGTNVTTLDADVKNSYNAEAIVMFNWTRCGLTVDFGYDLWARAAESICITGCIDGNYGILGGSAITGEESNFVAPDATIRTNGTSEEFATALTVADLDVDGAETPKAFSNKVFAHVGYTWEDCDYMPFLGLGGEVEFSGSDNKALNQWAVWVKGGFSFL